ncbi:hypothetical protein CASFOL_006052 [Castilleja foliolosa]|uniref:C2H2-type domain-containing protein n=1 Tax=Castilleja foliolosa TaxID=1961234 RepID=A0ABD3E672_9LAMI
MEAVEVLAAAAPPPPHHNNVDLSPIIAKGKRTKRQRPHSPIPFSITITTQNNVNENDNENDHDWSPTASDESTTTEEVDTAKCLVLMSQGYFSTTPPDEPSKHNTGVYTCKTCTRSFPSFQALGGHRASHKKPRNEKVDFPSPSSLKKKMSFNSLSLQLSNNTAFSANLMKSSPSPRIHECSYCGAEFTSGQALGGHMRKHRAGPVARLPEMIVEEVGPEESKKPISKIGLSLDLNLPAPEVEKEKSFRPGFSHHYYSTID